MKKVGGTYPYDFLTSMDTSGRAREIDENDKKIVTLKMTGSQILQALEYPANSQNTAMFEQFWDAAA